MKNKISQYWPLAIVASLATGAWLHIGGGAGPHADQAPLDADRVTAELARAVSYGIIDTTTLHAKPSRAPATLPVSEAS